VVVSDLIHNPLYERGRRFLIGGRPLVDRPSCADAAGGLRATVRRARGRPVLVLRSRRGFDPRKGKEKTWLYSIALNLLRDQARRGQAAERALERAAAGSPVGDASGSLERIEGQDELDRALRALSPEEREAVALRYGADLTVPEVAKVLGEPLQRVEGRVYRALRKLRGELTHG
jgi:RNA polymerase sigma-70 factor (ECF subfamily)